MIREWLKGWTPTMYTGVVLGAAIFFVFFVAVMTRKRSIAVLLTILAGSVGFRVYLMYGNPSLEDTLHPYFFYFRVAVLSMSGLVLLLAVWPWVRRKLFGADTRICKDWFNEKDKLERFRKRLAFETYAVNLDNIKVWRRRKIYVTITAPRYPGEYLLPESFESRLDTLKLDELVDYRQACLIDDPPCPTYINALDKVLDGGTYRGQLNLIQGPVRSGRSLAATLIAASVINNGGKVLFVTAHTERHKLVKGIVPLLADPSPEVLNRQFRSFRFPVNQPVSQMIADASKLLLGVEYDFAFVDNVEDLQNAGGDIPDRLMAGKVWAVSEALKKWSSERGLPLWVAVQGDFTTMELVATADNTFLTSFKEDNGNAKVTLRPLSLRRTAVKAQDIALTLVKS